MVWRRVGDWLVAVVRLAAGVCTAVVALLLVAALLAGFVLVPVFGIGLPVVAGAVGATRALADLHRRAAGRVLGASIDGVYTESASRLRDPQTGRDALWLLGHGLLGLASAWVGFVVLVVVLFIANRMGDSNPVGDVLFSLMLVFIAALVWWTVPWGVQVLARFARALLGPATSGLAGRVRELTESRAATVDASAAELRRIERDLHDGAQARLAAVGMTLGLASQALPADPHRAAELVAEARADAARALAELRDLVRGIHPPVLADRGLPGGLAAAALLCPVPVAVDVGLDGRPPEPVESALYFATTEVLANVGRHSGATRASLHAGHDGTVLQVVVRDDGRGGADPARGTGLRGIERRLAVFDGTLAVDSPPGGPTEIRMELPCALSSPRTTSSSATA